MPNNETDLKITVSGPIGAGKTTLGLYLAALLREKGIDFDLVTDEIGKEEALKRIVDFQVKGLETKLGRITINV